MLLENKRKIASLLIILVSMMIGIFYYFKFWQDFLPEVYDHLNIAQNFKEHQGFSTNYLPLPALKAYDRQNFLYQDPWPSLFRGPFMGFSLAFISQLLALSLESSFLFLTLTIFILLAFISFKFFQRFLPLDLSIFAVLALIVNFRLVSILFDHPEFAVNLLVFLSVFYLFQRNISLQNIIFASVILGLNLYNSNLSLLFFIIFFFYIASQGEGRRKKNLLFYTVIFLLIVSPFLYYRYKLTHNPFYSLEIPLHFVSFTDTYPGSDVHHHLTEIVVRDFLVSHPREVFLKFLSSLQEGFFRLPQITGNYILFALGFCGFFYNFQRFSLENHPKSKKLDKIKSFLGGSLLFYFLLLALFQLEAEQLLIFLPFILVWGIGFLVCEINRRQIKCRNVLVYFFLLILLFINFYPFILRGQGARYRDDFEFYVPQDRENIINLGPPKLAYYTKMKTFALPPMPRYVEDIEQSYYLKVYSVYLDKEVIENNQSLRFGGWEKIMQKQELPGFKLVKKFPQGDLFFVRIDEK